MLFHTPTQLSFRKCEYIDVMSPQTADQLLARADAAKALAEEAARKSSGTLQEANTILSNLKGKEEAVEVNPSIPV